MIPIKLLILILILCAVVYADRCQDGWRPYKDHCYFFSDVKMNWTNARAFCNKEDGNLATVTSEGEYDFIVQQIILEGTSHNFIGGTDLERDGVWTWESTGEKVTFTKWNPGQPNGKTVTNCLLLNQGYGYKWDDIQCQNKYAFVCEKDSSQCGTTHVQPCPTTCSNCCCRC